MQKILWSFFLTIVFASPLAAQELSGTLKQIAASGTMRIGYQEMLPPMSYKNKDGVPAGYSIDLCNLIADEAERIINRDVIVEYIPVLSKDRFSAIADNKIDIMCDATTKTMSREEMVDFSQLTFVTGASLVTLRETDHEAGFEGKRIGVTEGTTTAAALGKLLKASGIKAQTVSVKSSREGFRALNKGEIDAYAADQVVLIGLALASGQPANYYVSPNLFTYEPFALPIRRNDSDFRLVVDRVISGLYRSGRILDYYDKWFGVFSRERSPAFDALIQINAIPE